MIEFDDNLRSFSARFLQATADSVGLLDQLANVGARVDGQLTVYTTDGYPVPWAVAYDDNLGVHFAQPPVK